jgi:hypothetical protein
MIVMNPLPASAADGDGVGRSSLEGGLHLQKE